ncbi:MAG: C4-dicarboxylate transporter permease [Clostridiales bacterium]|jgi:putative tricarboxylic transport membrane protein|nr:C4-dicarboxylate transporter permease [Clostridiales bacterium]
MAEFLQYFAGAMGHIFNLSNFLLMTLGVAAGIVVGCLPGLTATMALAVLVPFTFTMDPATGLMTLGGIYVGAIYGGCISAILINTPGTPSAIATTFDGYPLTKKGKGEHALVAAAYSSGVGGVIGAILLMFLAPLLVKVALKFGPPEYFWLATFGLTIIATLSAKSLLKGVIGGTLGLLIATIGLAPIGGEMRYTFGFYQLQAGIELIVALIGFFCVPEILSMVEEVITEKKEIQKFKSQKGVAREVIVKLTKQPFLLIRSAIIGCFVGIVPGAGGNVAGLVSYNEAVRWSKEPEKFGTGVVEGVAASESSNNAEVGGSLVPLLTLGIPGAPPAAVLMGALMLQGMRPGPDLFVQHGDITYTFLISLVIANIVMFVLGFYGAKYVARLINLPASFLAPMIAFMTIIGSYSIRNNMLDVFIMVGMGLLGYILRKLDFHPGPIVLGMILGPIAEKGLVQSMMLARSQGSILEVFFTRPISIVLIILCLISAFWPMISEWNKKRRGESQGVSSNG